MRGWGRPGDRRGARVAAALACIVALEVVRPPVGAALGNQGGWIALRAVAPIREDTYTTSTPNDVQRWVVTPDGTDAYSLALGPRTVRGSAPATNDGGNLRMVWWPSRAPASVDSESCLTWTRRDSVLAQPGVALRVRRDGGRSRAITVTNNITFGARWAWNTHIWESGRPFRQIGATYLTQAFGDHPTELPPLPWRLCARAIGSTVELKAWPTSRTSEPAWGDARYGGSVALPPGWVFPGRSGWYLGHLHPGDWSEANEIGSWALRQTPGDEYGLAMEEWAGGLYPLLFDRSADDGYRYWADQAMARGGSWVVSTMGTSLEARRKTVTDLYQQVLRRAPDPDGLTYWADRLLVRPNVEELILAVVLQDEFSGQRDDRTFVTDLYDRILERSADPDGVDHWVDQLAGGVSRSAVASLFVRSSENRVRTVRAVHQEVFGREPTAEEQMWWGAWFVGVGLNRLRLQSAMTVALMPPVPA